MKSWLVVAALIVATLGVATSPTAHASTSLPPPHLTALDAGRKSGTFSATTTGPQAANAYVQRNWQVSAYCGTVRCQPGQTPNPYIGSIAHIIPQAVPPAGRARFFANQFAAFQGGDPNGGYIGLQTDVITNGVDVGRGVIVSIWGALGAVPGGPGITAVSGTEMNDTFWSLHYTYPWTVGHQYALWLNTNLNGTITAGFDDNTAPATYTLGTFSVPATWKGFGLQQVEWTEDYLGGPYSSCSAIPVSRMRALGSSTLTATYPHYGVYDTSPEIPYIQSGTGCTNSASTLVMNQAYDLIVGATS